MKEIIIPAAAVGFVLVFNFMLFYKERRRRKKAELNLLYEKWCTVCQELLLWKLRNIHDQDYQSDPSYDEIWMRQNRLASEYKMSGGEENVNFEQVHGHAWELYSPIVYTDSSDCTKALNSLSK